MSDCPVLGEILANRQIDQRIDLDRRTGVALRRGPFRFLFAPWWRAEQATNHGFEVTGVNAALRLGGLLACLGALFAVAYHDRYWRWRDCFNELGRCYDPVSQDVFLEQAGMIWGSLAIIFLAIGLAMLLRPGR